MLDRHGNCGRVVAAAQLQAVNVAGVRSQAIYRLFILFSLGKGVILQHARSKQKRGRSDDVVRLSWTATFGCRLLLGFSVGLLTNV